MVLVLKSFRLLLSVELFTSTDLAFQLGLHIKRWVSMCETDLKKNPD